MLECGEENFTLSIGYKKRNVPKGKERASYSDADYAGDSTTRKSMSGCVSFLAGGPVV